MKPESLATYESAVGELLAMVPKTSKVRAVALLGQITSLVMTEVAAIGEQGMNAMLEGVGEIVRGASR